MQMKGAGELDRPIFFKTIILKGRDGTSIGSLEKTATVGATDTYTITLTDGETYTFEVTNGTSISNISYTSSSGNVDTYTVTLTDGSTTTFNVTNGEDFTVPTDGVIYYDGADIPDGYEEAPAPSGSGSYATIDDSNVSVSTTYSSSKIEQLISGVGGGGVDYSTTEQDTGLKWIDGRPIYQKTYEQQMNEISTGWQGLNYTIFGGNYGLKTIKSEIVYQKINNINPQYSQEWSGMFGLLTTYNDSAAQLYSPIAISDTGFLKVTIFYTKASDTPTN
jgi:hypothetical protein